MIPYLLIAVFATSFFITGAIRRYALARQLMDIPNARSSHSVPTPRGGGVGFVVAFLLALPFLVWAGVTDARGALAIGIPGLIVAVLGFVDDHGHVAARWRLLGHFTASVIGLWLMNGLPPVEIAGRVLDLGWVGNVLAVFYLVWMLNLFNFMDGIDGLASAEAIFIFLGISALHMLQMNLATALIALFLALSVTAFIIWNCPPAKIFMGDAGSGFLGVMVGIIVLVSARSDPDFLWGGLILSGVFVTDATVTLFRRLVAGFKVYEAHRTHAYQHAARKLSSHGKVTRGVTAINILWLLPISIWVTAGGGDGFLGTVIAYLPLIALSLLYRAGSSERR